MVVAAVAAHQDSVRLNQAGTKERNMNRQQGLKAKFKSRQQGAVAIIVAFSLVLLVGMLGLVLDLGHLYVTKTELQNAADAAALSGAKRLDGTLCGISSALGDCGTNKGAVELAIETAGLNSYDFNDKSVAINATNIRVGTCPDDSCMKDISEITSEALAADKTFLEVDTGQISFNTWFVHVLSDAISGMGTFGLAVAGRYSLHVTPMGVCAVQVGAPEQGFIRGVAYNIPQLNPLGVQADQIWINPIDSYPGACDKNNATPTRSYPFVCGGRISPIISALPAKVYYDTGVEATLNGPLNSRFGVPSSYTGGQACDPDLSPADANVHEFICKKTGGGPSPENCQVNPSSPSPDMWMEPAGNTLPSRQTIEIINRKPFNYPTRAAPELAANFERYGVLWTYSKEINSSGVPYSATDTDWTNLYGGKPQSYSSVAPSPYEKGLTATGQAERRVVNMLIMDCDPAKVETVGSCKALPVVSIGKFFIQRQADLPTNLAMEFAGVFETPLPLADIRLYR